MQTVSKNDKDIALTAYMKQNGIGFLFISQEQRELAKKKLDFIAKFLAPFLKDEQFVDLFISESKKNLVKEGIPGILVSDFLKFYEAKTGKSLIYVNTQNKVNNVDTNKFLALVEGFELQSDKETIIIKPQMYMAVLDDRFFKTYEKPKGIFAAHFIETNESINFYTINDKGYLHTNFKSKKDLSFTSNILVGGFYDQRDRYFLFKESEGNIINMMNATCSCFNSRPGPICFNGHCLPGGSSSGCGYVEEIIPPDGGEPYEECVPYCCEIAR